MAIVRKLTSEWQDFNGEYEKTMYDIELHNGQVFHMCWPNAGKFTVLGAMGKAPVPCNQVKRVRESEHQF